MLIAKKNCKTKLVRIIQAIENVAMSFKPRISLSYFYIVSCLYWVLYNIALDQLRPSRESTLVWSDLIDGADTDYQLCPLMFFMLISVLCCEV